MQAGGVDQPCARSLEFYQTPPFTSCGGQTPPFTSCGNHHFLQVAVAGLNAVVGESYLLATKRGGLVRRRARTVFSNIGSL